jgi:predicted nucleic-acid-binding Zn-ribbon protein
VVELAYAGLMRTAKVCPKCQHNRILLIERMPDMGEVSSEIRELHVATAFVGESYFGNEKLTTVGKLSACVCRKCGYTELYTKDPDKLNIDGRYITELVGPAR